MRFPRDGKPCPSSGPALLARIEALVDPWQRLRVRAIWIFSGYMRPRARTEWGR